jgi:hypothetical protein
MTEDHGRNIIDIPAKHADGYSRRTTVEAAYKAVFAHIAWLTDPETSQHDVNEGRRDRAFFSGPAI